LNKQFVVKGLITLATLLVLCVGVSVAWSTHSSAGLPRAAFDVAVPDGQEFAEAVESAHFDFKGTVRLGNRTPGGMREVLVEVLVTNKTTQPIRHLSIGAILDDQVVRVIEAQTPFFGTAVDDDHNLIPGEIPYGIYVSRTMYTLDPEQFGPDGKEELLRTLGAPIRLKLKWAEGTEYIQVRPVVTGLN
jgi:hypothetical protein